MGDSVVFLCVNKGDSAEVVDGLWKKKGFTTRAVRQEGTEVCDAFGVIAFPTIYVIGPDGTIRYRSTHFDGAALRAMLLK